MATETVHITQISDTIANLSSSLDPLQIAISTNDVTDTVYSTGLGYKGLAWKDAAGNILYAAAINQDAVFNEVIIDTLTIITGLDIQDTAFTLQDDGNNTKQAQFNCSAISASTTRTFSFPDKDGTVMTELADDVSPTLAADLVLGSNRSFYLTDNEAVAWLITEAGNAYITFTTLNGSEAISTSVDLQPISITMYGDIDMNSNSITGASSITGLGSLEFSTGVGVGTILDEDAMGSDSDTALATQQSIKAYVDNTVADYLPLVGGTMSGDILMDGSGVTGADQFTATVNTDATAVLLSITNSNTGNDAIARQSITCGPESLHIQVNDAGSGTYTTEAGIYGSWDGLAIGNGPVNFSEFEADGTLVFHGDAVVWDDLRVPFSAISKAGVNDPDYIQFRNDGSTSTGVYGYAFDASSTEEVFFTAQVPHRYKEGTDLEMHIHWSPPNTNSGDVVWAVETTWANVGAAFPTTAEVAAAHAASGTAYQHQYAELGTLTGTGKTISSIIKGRLYRAGGSGSDTYASDAFGHEFDFHYQIDTVGSRTEAAK